MMKLTCQALALHLHLDEGLTLKTSVLSSFHAGTFTLIGLFNTKFECFNSETEWTSDIADQGPVAQKPINANPRLKVNQRVYFSTPRCCSTLMFGKTIH